MNAAERDGEVLLVLLMGYSAYDTLPEHGFDLIPGQEPFDEHNNGNNVLQFDASSKERIGCRCGRPERRPSLGYRADASLEPLYLDGLAGPHSDGEC